MIIHSGAKFVRPWYLMSVLGYVLVLGMLTLTRDIFVSLQLAISVYPSIKPHNPSRTFVNLVTRKHPELHLSIHLHWNKEV